MLLISLLVFKTVLLNSAFAVQQIPFARSTWIKTLSADRQENHRRLLQYAYRTLPTRNIYECASTCLKDSRCQSYNFFRVQQLCEINSEQRIDDGTEAWIRYEGKWVQTINGLSPWNDTEYHSRDSYSFSGKVPLDESVCSQFTCSKDYMCWITPGGTGRECIRVHMAREDILLPWSKWSSWGKCSATCNTGVQERVRTCNSTGREWLCKGHREERKICSGVICPIWSYWSTWSACSTITSCGTGTRRRTRTCLYGERRHCSGNNVQTDGCTTISCQAAIRLISGVVQILDESEPADPKWRTACRVQSGSSPSSDSTVHETICHQLALGKPVYSNISDVAGRYMTYITPRHCNETDKLLLQCSHYGWSVNTNCKERLIVSCSDLNEMTICNGSKSLLRCARGVIDIRSIAAGNTNNQSCSSDPSADTEIETSCTSADVLSGTKYECNGRRICSLKTAKEFWNRDCNETLNYLRIRYQCLTEDTGFWSSWSSWSMCGENNLQTRERKLIHSQTSNDFSTSNEIPMEKRNCKRKNEDVKYKIDDITHKLLILDPISLTWKYARSELWRQQNSNIACKELKMITSLDFFVWMGRTFLLMEGVIGSGDKTITIPQRCQAINGETVIIYDYELQDIENQNDPDSLLRTVKAHYGHCSVSSDERGCMYLISKKDLKFCAAPGACSIPLGMESGGIDDSAITVSSVQFPGNSTANKHGPENIRLNWAGLHLQPEGGGWRPDLQDTAPWVMISFKGIKKFTSIMVAKYASTEESIELKLSYSIDEETHWQDPTSITIIAGTNYAYKFFEQSTRSKSPIATFLKLQSTDVIQFSSLKLEIFGCGFFPVDDAACHSELELKQHLSPTSNSKYELYLQNYSSVDNSVLKYYMNDIHGPVTPKYEITWLPKDVEYHGCNLSDLARETMSGCHWFEIEFLHKAVITSITVKGWKTKYLSGNHHTLHSPFLEQTLEAPDIEDSNSVCWTNLFLLMYYRDNDWHYYGSDSNFLSGNTDGYNFITKQLKTTLITNRIRVIPLSWNSRPCITMVFRGCYLHDMYNSYFNEQSLPFPKENAYSNTKVSCSGSETSSNQCTIQTVTSSSLREVPVTLICDEIPDHKNDSDSESAEKSKFDNNIGTFSETNMIPVTEYYMSFSDTEDTSYEWCMNIAGDSMKIEFKQVIELFGIKLVFSEEKFSRNVLQGFFRAFIKWSLDKVTWIVVNPEMLTFNRYEKGVQISVKQYVYAKYLRVHPVVIESMHLCCSIEIYGYQSEYNPDKAKGCIQPLGMENGNIANEKITASSYFDEHHLPSHGRLGFDNNATINDGWACSLSDLQGNSWIQIQFPSKYMVTGIITQGSGYIHHVKSYKIAYSDDGSTWLYVLEQDNTHMVFTANSDSSSKATNYISTPIITNFIRLYPLLFHTHITMRLEVLGCSPNGEMLPELGSNMTLSLLQSQMELYKPGNNYEYWTVPKMKMGYLNTHCMMNGGLLSSKQYLNLTVARQVSTHLTDRLIAVGITDTSRLEIFEDVDQIIAADPTYWSAREPNPQANEHCIIVKQSGLWHDVGCHYSVRGICEKPSNTSLMQNRTASDDDCRYGDENFMFGNLLFDQTGDFFATGFPCNDDFPMYSISKHHSDLHSLLRISERNLKGIHENFISSSYDESNPPWMAFPTYCGSWCMLKEDSHRWIQVDLGKLVLVHSIIISPQSHQCLDANKEEIFYVYENLSVDTPKPTKVSLSIENSIWTNVKPLQFKLHSDNSYIWMLKRLTVARFVKIVFTKEDNANCATIDVTGRELNLMDMGTWKDRFTPMQQSVSGVDTILVIKTVDEVTCSYQCLNITNHICSLYTFDGENCTLFALDKGETLNQVNTTNSSTPAWFQKENLFTYVFSSSRMLNEDPAQYTGSFIEYVNGSELLGCFKKEMIKNLAPVYNQYYYTPKECVHHCFALGYENAALKLGGICLCGDAISGKSKILTLHSLEIEQFCNIPCRKDPTLTCGGSNYALIYQKPGRCFRSFLAQKDESYYCFHGTRATYSHAEAVCSSSVSPEELTNPIQSKELYRFIQEWMSKLQNSSDYTVNRGKVMSIWAGKYNEYLHDDFPSWITLEKDYTYQSDDTCIYIDLYLHSNASLEYGIIRAADCNAFVANYICDLGMCDAHGNCKESSNTKVRKELKQSIEFIVIQQAMTWYESREICLQRGMDLCMADDICNANFANGFSYGFYDLSSRIQTPIRDNFMDFLIIDKTAESCTLKSKASTANSDTRALFCCGMKKSSTIVHMQNSHASISSIRRSGPFSLSSLSASISLVGQEKIRSSCCSDCFKINNDNAVDSQFYIISPGLNEVGGTVSFESVDMPGYFLTYCEDEGDSLILIVEKWSDSDSSTFWKRSDNAYKQDCHSRYESYELPSMYIFINADKQLLNIKSPDKDWLDSTCIVTNKGFHLMHLNPDRFTWQSAREFCNDRGKDLCSYEKLASAKVNSNSKWIPVINDENEWGRFSGVVHERHNIVWGAPIWGIQPGICYGWGDASNICPLKEEVYCCDAVKYLKNNEEDPLSSFKFPVYVGDAIEYGCWTNASNHNLTKFENQPEESCYVTCKEQGIYAYGYAEPNSCFGISNGVFTDGMSALTICNKTDIKVFRIPYQEISENIRFAMDFQPKPMPEHHSLSVSSENLYSFTQSFWYQDTYGGGAFLYYTSSVAADDILTAESASIVLAIFKIPERNTFIINICGISLMYDSTISFEQRFNWHNLILTLHEQEGIVMYLDGKIIKEYGGRNIENECFLPADGRIQIGTIESEHILKNMSILFDMWNYSLTASHIRKFYSKFSITGNLISSADTAHFKNSTEHLLEISSRFLRATKWLQFHSAAFVLSVRDSVSNNTRQGIVQSAGSGAFVKRCILSDVKKNCFPLTHPLSGNCATTSEFEYVPVSRYEFNFQFTHRFMQISKYFQLINRGKGILELKTRETLADSDLFSVVAEKKSLNFKKLKISDLNTRTGLLTFFEKNLELTLTYDKCDTQEIYYRDHLNYSPRICLQNMWHETTSCTVPLFHHGTFLDYLLEKWRASAHEGGLRAYGIRQLMKYIHAKAVEPVSSFYHVCHGGYNIRLLRISQKLLTNSNVPPNKSIKSGVLQYYIQGIGWGNVCMKQLSDTTFAQVACKQLGFSGVKMVSYAKHGEETDITFRNPFCQGEESSLDECAERYDIYCDSTQSVHVTCDIVYEDLPDPWIPLTEHLFLWNEKLAQTQNFDESQALCKHLGGSLPEPTSYEATQLLIIHMNYFQLDNVWLGARRFNQTMLWMTSGDFVINYFLAYTERDGNCVSMNKDGSWTENNCNDPTIGTICIKTTGCPKGFTGVDCEIHYCPDQTLYGVQATCPHNHNNSVVNQWCRYECIGSGKFIGQENRQCVYDSLLAIIWNGVDPLCDSDTTLNAEGMCMKYEACQNGGTCIEVSSNIYSCQCMNGYEGLNCQINNKISKFLPSKSVNRCHFNFCSNYGICIAEYQTFKCLCPNGYFGNHCEMLPASKCNPNPCLNNGICVLAGHNNFICRCEPGYSGRACEKSFEDTNTVDLCAFPFQFNGKNYTYCTSEYIDIYRDLGCWNDLQYAPGLHNLLIVPQNETNFIDFLYLCHQKILDLGWKVFAIKLSQDNHMCLSAKDASQQYTRHGYSVDCDEDAMYVYEIVHENIDLTWCSTDSVYNGNYVFCEPTPQRLLLQPNPIVDVIVDHSKQNCFERDSSTIGRIQFESESNLDLLSYISEVLSCVHYGRKQLYAYENPKAFSVPVKNGTCKFPAFNEDIIQFSCFYEQNTSFNSIPNLPMCYNEADQMRYCLDRYYQERLPCRVSERIHGYRLTTTFAGLTSKHNCVFPFIHDTVEYYDCSLGWCYTDENGTEESGWTYCHQDQCVVYPRPPTHTEDSNAPEVTETNRKFSCDDSEHLYFGRQITQYACEQACSLQTECRGYAFLPENKNYYYSGKVYGVYKDIKSYKQTKQRCKEIGGTLLNLPQSNAYEYLKMIITEKKPTYDSFWTTDASDICYSLQVNTWMKTPADCNLNKAYICERDANEEELESYLLGQTIAEVGYCIGMRFSMKLNKTHDSVNSVRSGITLSWGLKKNQCRNYKNTGKSNMSQHSIESGYHNEPNTGRQFKIFTDTNASWTEANDICQSDGGHLAIVNSYEMEQYLKKLMRKKGNIQQAYFGLNDNYLSWVDGSFVRYINHNQTIVTNGFCMTLSTNSTSWEPIECGSKLSFICENYIVKVTVSKDFRKLTSDIKADFSNGNRTDLVEIIETDDEELCMDRCLKLYNVWKQCRSFLFNNSHCLLLAYDASSSDSRLMLRNGGEYSYFEITLKDSCYVSLLTSFESLLVTVGHDVGSEVISKSDIVHSTSSKSYCFALAEDGGKLWIKISLALMLHVTGITADFDTDKQDLNATAQILQSRDKTQWQLLRTEDNMAKIRHFLDKTEMKYIKITFSYNSFDRSYLTERLCIKFDIIGCVLSNV